MTGTGMRRTAGKILHSVRGILCLIFAVILTAGTACADVFIDQEKPEDWEDRYLLRIYALRSLDCDAYILECDGERMILDGGKNASYLTEFMEKKGFSHVDMIFNSHPHDDHIDAVYYAILKDRLTADVFYSPFRENYSDAADTFQKRTVRELAAKGIPYRQVFNGDELMLGGARIKVYRYDGDTKKPNGGSITINDMSAVLRVRFGDTAMLMTADIGGTIQQMLAKDYGAEGGLKAEILTAPHHGKNAMNGDLLKAVNPKLTIITGKVSRTEDCRKQMENFDIEWKRTSYGDIVLETDGKDWYINQEDPYGEVEKQRKLKEKRLKQQQKKKKK